jgi:hypothetical protein
MAAAGYAMGTVIQAILNALGLGPDRVFELMNTPRPLRDTGMTRAQRNLQESLGKAPEKPSPAPPTPAIDPFFSNNP